VTGEAMSATLAWERDGCDWPNREASCFMRVAGVRWHVQVMGQGPCLLLLHGTGASTHSWRDLAPRLSTRFCVVAPDLPGHAFTKNTHPDLLSLPGMARAVKALLDALGATPALVAGHSAGAAVLVRMTLTGLIAPRALVSLNGALLPLSGLAGQVFSPAARLLASTSLVPRLFAWRAREIGVVEQLIRDTGSKIDPVGIEFYRRLASNSGHVAAALGMMANWDLELLARDLPSLEPPLLLVVGGSDRTIPPEDAFRVRDLLPSSSVEYLRGLGHLAHEEQPDLIAAIIRRVALAGGVLPTE